MRRPSDLLPSVPSTAGELVIRGIRGIAFCALGASVVLRLLNRDAGDLEQLVKECVIGLLALLAKTTPPDRPPAPPAAGDVDLYQLPLAPPEEH